MVISMTGFGRGEASGEGASVTVEVRSVNNRYLEVSTRIPKDYSTRENELREIVKKMISRGKVSLSVNIEREEKETTFEVDEELAASYKEALTTIRKAGKIKEGVNLSHLLVFRDDLIRRSSDEEDVEQVWEIISEATKNAVQNLYEMRKNEGRELAHDLRKRIQSIDKMVESVEKISEERVPEERTRLRERIARLFENDEIDEQRLEQEIVILADKLDVTEECVRYKSHSKFFLQAIKDREPSGRRLNFLLQEMHREVNTIGSKGNHSKIAHLVVNMKEELERIREQVQNIE